MTHFEVLYYSEDRQMTSSESIFLLHSVGAFLTVPKSTVMLEVIFLFKGGVWDMSWSDIFLCIYVFGSYIDLINIERISFANLKEKNLKSLCPIS